MNTAEPIRVIWHGNYTEKPWLEYLFSNLNVQYSSIDKYPISNPHRAIHVIGTNDTGILRADSAEILRAEMALGKNFGLVHVGDEWFRADTSWYKGARFVIKLFQCTFIRHAAIKYVPIGFPNTSCFVDSPRPASARSLIWSFAGGPNYTRKCMVNALNRIKPHAAFLGSPLTPHEYRAILADSVFIPSPLGNANPECYRFYEALESGCVPIVEKRWTIDYFGRLFDQDCPIPRFYSWKAAAKWLEDHRDGEFQDQLQQRVRSWWASKKLLLRDDITQFVLKRFQDQEGDTLDSWQPPFRGKLHTARWLLELCRYTTPGALLDRVRRQVSRQFKERRLDGCEPNSRNLAPPST